MCEEEGGFGRSRFLFPRRPSPVSRLCYSSRAMKRLVPVLLLILAACAPKETAPTPKPTSTPLIIPTRMPFPTRIPATLPGNATSAPESSAPDSVKFLEKFSSRMADWQVLPGSVTAEQINQAVAALKGETMHRVNQKVMNGFLRTTVTQIGGQVYEVLSPAEIADGKLKPLTLKNVRQTPILSSHAVLLEDYFAVNFPDVVAKWEAQGARYEDFKYAAVITVTWATKYGPLRVSYKLSGKYIAEEGKYPGRVDFLKLCMYEQAIEHYTANNKLAPNWYPEPIVGLSGTLRGVSGKLESDAFGWTPMADVAEAEKDILAWIGQAVSGVPIESKETLAQIQTAFNRAFLPVHCAETVIQ